MSATKYPDTYLHVCECKSGGRTMNAFDYARQVWTADAVRVRAEQIHQELGILRGPRGAEYLRFCGADISLEAAIERLEKELAGIDP